MKKTSVSIRIGMLCMGAALIAAACSAQGTANASPNGSASVATASSNQRVASSTTASNSATAPSSTSSTSSSNSTIGSGVNIAQAQQPAPAMTNAGGDIPDSQQFVAFASQAGGYNLEVPEGWARMENGSSVQFVNHYDGVWVHVSSQSQAPTVSSVQANQVNALESNRRAVRVDQITTVTIDNHRAILVSYDSNSAPNAVTNKQIRLENNTYFYYRNGKVAELRMWAPLGADNVDQWRRMSRSFRWQ